MSDNPVPPWLQPMTTNRDRIDGLLNGRARRIPKALMRKPRQAAVLVVFAGDPTAESIPDDASVILTKRADTLRQHSGQVAFPGGARDPGDDFPVGTAMREAHEEVGIAPDGLVTVTSFMPVPVVPSQFMVTPVVAYDPDGDALVPCDPAETEQVTRASVHELLDPARRFQVGFPRKFFTTPAIELDDLLVWGLTAGIFSAIVEGAGWERPWDKSDIRDLATVQRRNRGSR